MNYFINPYLNILNFKGRASLKQYWYFIIINFLISILLILIKKLHGIDQIDVYYRYIYLLPLISLGFRRIQDTGKSGWLYLIPLVNIVLAGFIEGDRERNKYGDPISD